MAGYSAPGVYRREIDLSEILVSQGISDGGIVVRARKGPVSQPVLVQNDKEYIDTFGAPYFVSGADQTTTGKLTPELGYGAYGAIEFLSESNALYVFRAYDDDNSNTQDDLYGYVQIGADATAKITSVGLVPTAVADIEVFDTRDRIKRYEDFNNSEQTNPLMIGAVGPGLENNNIAVTVEVLNPYSDWLYNYDEWPTDLSATLSTVPTTDWIYPPDPLDPVENAGLKVPEVWVTTSGGTVDEVKKHFPIASDVVKVTVYVKPDNKKWDELFANDVDKERGILRIQPLEVFYGSLYPQQDDDGNDIFIESAINGASQFIYVKSLLGSSIPVDTNWNFDGVSATTPTWRDTAGIYIKHDEGVFADAQFSVLSGGDFHLTTGTGSSDADFWALFDNREELPVNILINPNENQVHKMEAAKVCAARMDCIVANQVGTVTTTAPLDIINDEPYGYPNPSFVALYSGYSKIYDKYNDRQVYIPNSIYGASLMARVDTIAEPWYAPAGTTRGIMAVLDQNRIYNQDQIGMMYDKNINSVKYVRGIGFSMGGQKTAQLKNSALDRINVRRNLIYIETNIERSLNQFVFENNTQQTRLRVFSMIDNFLAGIVASEGLYSYSVVCDETNNTPSVVDSNQLNVDIYVQPTRTIEFIQFTTVITRTGVSFSDVQLKYA